YSARNEGCEDGVLHAVVHGPLAGEVRGESGHRVGAVEATHLALAIRRDVVGEDHVETSLAQGQLRLDRPVALDAPRMQRRSDDEERGLVTKTFRELGGLRLRISGHDAIDEGAREKASLREKPIERLRQTERARRLSHGAFELDSVLLDELARQH